MYDDEVTQVELDDAVIEDTVHCTLCGISWVLGGNGDGIFVTLPASGPLFGHIGGQLKLCIECALQVKKEIELLLAEKDVCEHGVVCGDWCQPCNEAYKTAMADPSNR